MKNMAEVRRLLLKRNPWIKNPKRILRDTYIRTYLNSKFKRRYESLLKTIFLSKYTIVTGPPLVGKTTLLKLLTKKLITENDLVPIYLHGHDIETIGIRDLLAVIKFLRIRKKICLLIDDLNTINQQKLVRLEKLIENTQPEMLVIASCHSRSIDLFQGFLRVELLPLNFMEFFEMLHGKKKLVRGEEREQLHKLLGGHSGSLDEFTEDLTDFQSIFEIYLLSGGLFPFVEEVLKYGFFSEDSLVRLYRSIYKTVRNNCKEYLKEVFVSILQLITIPYTLESRASKAKIIRENFIQCINDLADVYIVGLLGYDDEYKIYFRDPIFFSLAVFLQSRSRNLKRTILKWVKGDRVGYLVENVVFEHLYRMFSRSLKFMRVSSGEIDFLIELLQGRSVGVEVKYRTRVRYKDISKLRTLYDTEHVSPMILSRTNFVEESIPQVPVSAFLYVFGYLLEKKGFKANCYE
ncbi:MAG: DUF4143 domain-containing protein [Candidatus Njordarchaeales archaeon]